MSESVAAPSTAIRFLLLEQVEAAAALLAGTPGLPDLDSAANALAAAEADGEIRVLALNIGDELAGVYLLAKSGMANEVRFLTIAAAFRGQGYGKMCLYDALLRSGKRPLVIECGDESLGFFKACGFKMVGKRKGPNGEPRYRLGWHAPIPKPGGGELVC